MHHTNEEVAYILNTNNCVGIINSSGLRGLIVDYYYTSMYNSEDAF